MRWPRLPFRHSIGFGSPLLSLGFFLAFSASLRLSPPTPYTPHNRPQLHTAAAKTAWPLFSFSNESPLNIFWDPIISVDKYIDDAIIIDPIVVFKNNSIILFVLKYENILYYCIQ